MSYWRHQRLRSIRRQARTRSLCPTPQWTDEQLLRLLSDVLPMAAHPHELGRQLRKRWAIRKRRVAWVRRFEEQTGMTPPGVTPGRYLVFGPACCIPSRSNA